MKILITTFFKKKFFILNNVNKRLVDNVDVEYENTLSTSIYNSIKINLENYNNSNDLNFFSINDQTLLLSDTNSGGEKDFITTLDLANVVNQKTALELPIYSGKILFIKQQNTLICLVCFFQPPKGNFKVINRRKKKLKKSLKNLNIARYLNFSKDYNPLYFNKNTF